MKRAAWAVLRRCVKKRLAQSRERGRCAANATTLQSTCAKRTNCNTRAKRRDGRCAANAIKLLRICTTWAVGRRNKSHQNAPR
eukprot:5918207-Pyramimonas_sp.AAC.1